MINSPQIMPEQGGGGAGWEQRFGENRELSGTSSELPFNQDKSDSCLEAIRGNFGVIKTFNECQLQ